MVNKMSTDVLEIDVQYHLNALRAMDGQNERETVEVTRGILRYHQETVLMLKREILSLRDNFRACYAAAWDATEHPVNVAKKHAREVLRKMHPVSDIVEQHDHDEDEW